MAIVKASYLSAFAIASFILELTSKEFEILKLLLQNEGKVCTKEQILETDSDEKIMIFTENPVLMNLGAQINRLLIERQKIKANFKKEQISSKKMLANIFHDIKTPFYCLM